MMGMQPEVEGVSSQIACGGTVRHVDARRRTLRRRVVAAIAIAAVAIGMACWEYLPGMLAWLADSRAVRGFVAENAAMSRLAMLGINIVQIFLAFLPGEPIELASGYAFGFWEGAALCLVASGFATSVIYWATRRWGWRLVGLFFDRSLLDRFSWLNNAKCLELVMLAVFLIPGTPKDFLTYFAGLTNMRFWPVVLIATFGRIPSIVTSTMAASAVENPETGPSPCAPWPSRCFCWPLAACCIAACAAGLVEKAPDGGLERETSPKSYTLKFVSCGNAEKV